VTGGLAEIGAAGLPEAVHPMDPLHGRFRSKSKFRPWASTWGRHTANIRPGEGSPLARAEAGASDITGGGANRPLFAEGEEGSDPFAIATGGVELRWLSLRTLKALWR
jgi:hypothetical protein